MRYKNVDLDQQKLIDLFTNMLRSRMIEEKMLNLLRQGKISKWFSGIGQEAIAVGATMALNEDEYIFPMHRNLGVFLSREIPLSRLFAQWEGKSLGFTKGRDRSFHFGTFEYNIVGMISHLGPQLSLAAGVALAHKLKNEPMISLAFTGEGGTSQGEFHEALNVAAVWNLPVIFLIENNGYGLSTPTVDQYACKDLVDRAKGYGMKGVKIDGNNVIEVYKTIDKIAEKIRKKPQPYLVECETFRMRGHEEASGVKYVPQELFDHWAERDPVRNFEAYLLKINYLDGDSLEALKTHIKTDIASELEIAYDSPNPTIDSESEVADVYAPYSPTVINPTSQGESKRFIDAISGGLDLAMQHHPDLILMGQDIAEYGGVFKITEGFVSQYGKERVRNTPLCESAIIGIALGASFKGIKSMIEMQFSDFVTCGFNQIVNNLAKTHYRWGANADVVIRMPCGGGVAAGPFHSQTNEAWFAKVPGLKIVYPSSPYDAKGLLLAAIADPNPVLYFEHKAMYRSITGHVPSEYYTLPIGKANLISNGNDAVIITYGMGVHWATELVEKDKLDVAILDLVSLAPLDYELISLLVKQTNKVLILHEDTLICGVGAEVSAYISEHLFEHLDAPVVRVGSLDTPIPFKKELEAQFMAKSRLKQALHTLLAY